MTRLKQSSYRQLDFLVWLWKAVSGEPCEMSDLPSASDITSLQMLCGSTFHEGQGRGAGTVVVRQLGAWVLLTFDDWLFKMVFSMTNGLWSLIHYSTGEVDFQNCLTTIRNNVVCETYRASFSEQVWEYCESTRSHTLLSLPFCSLTCRIVGKSKDRMSTRGHESWLHHVLAR